MAEKEAVRTNSPTGRVTNHSLFEKDVYKDEKGHEGKPEYKVELVVDPEDAETKALDEMIADVVRDEWGEDAEKDYWEGNIKGPLTDGDVYAKDRAARGKKGDAYEGMFIFRAHTEFNMHGESGPGGVYVCGADAEPLDFADRGKVYRGVYGLANVNLSPYIVSGKRGVTAYLNGFQIIKDGDRIGGGDPSSLFSPMMGKDSESKGRRGRGK